MPNHRNGRADPLREIARLTDQALKETDEALLDRTALTQRFLREIELEIREALKMLRALGDPWKHGDRTDYEVMRIALDKALTARKKERRDRLLTSWRDMLELKERQLALLKEASALGMVGKNGNGRNGATQKRA